MKDKPLEKLVSTLRGVLSATNSGTNPPIESTWQLLMGLTDHCYCSTSTVLLGKPGVPRLTRGRGSWVPLIAAAMRCNKDATGVSGFVD
jgi:hypothetical protein